MRLGQGPAIDVLAVSLSATDYVGHTFGTSGAEMCHQILALDAMLGGFFAKLDASKLPYAVVLTADHGGHDAYLMDGRYLVDEQALATLIEHRSKPIPPTRPSQKRLQGACDKMHAALTNGHETEARRLARLIVDEGTSVTDLIQQILVPPLRQIGTDWHDGKLSIWVEHRASSITERILGDVSPNPRGRRRGTAMVAAVAGDLHSLATSMAAAALREDNWNVHHLGADVPTAELVDFCQSQDLDLAVLTLTNPECVATGGRSGHRHRKDGDSSDRRRTLGDRSTTF